ncbi:hypothetical protein ACFXN2_02270 [Streptomyces kronopolitis]|uniref:Uncharacterized protein n=1 Tax=Streptomyces kronopolitis TaxID=1612435 RepID=A0ABQ2JEU9_9ACTN|nr:MULTISPECIES: hypothetical protein [Streptomyces]MCL6300077.1 hypothetical protein [Streptomyces kronopolitis]GGN43685.1 hypothetical protein GCM10012285_25340 [Streptomyces kronopolitis]
MRMVLKARIPTETGNEVIRNGGLPKIMESALAALKPEAAYFTLDDGERTAFFYFDMQESWQMPTLLESFFMDLNAQVSLQPVMTADDLRTGLGELMSGT